MLRRMMRCSFCNRRDSEVAKLVAGPLRIFAGRVYICDRCATQTIRIMLPVDELRDRPGIADVNVTTSSDDGRGFLP